MAEQAKNQDIQALRGAAILMVLIQHLSITATLLGRVQVTPTLDLPFYLGVELFFIISGYVVTRSILRGTADARAFVIRRALRLWPAMIVFIGFSAAVYLLLRFTPTVLQNEFAKTEFLGVKRFGVDSLATLTGTLINVSTDPLYYFGAMWSLSVEFQFYAAYAVIVGLLGQYLPRSALPGILRVTSGVITCILVAARVCDGWTGFHRADLPLLNYLIQWRFEFLTAGCYLALSKVETWPIWNRAVGVGLFAGLLMTGTIMGTGAKADPVLLPLALVACFSLVAAAARGKLAPATTSGWYRSLVSIGDRSYSIYLLHFPIMALFWWVVLIFRPGLFYADSIWYGLAQMTFVVGLSIALGDLSLRCIEEPFNALGHRIARRLTTRVGPKFEEVVEPA